MQTQRHINSHVENPPPVALDSKYFYDPELFPHLKLLTDNREVIAKELALAMMSKIVPLDQENGAEISGVWCDDKVFKDFYDRTKGEEGWLHWWSVNNPNQPNDQWTIFGLMHNEKFMTENCNRCPQTAELLSRVPGIRVAGFSRIQPRAGIDTHKGFTGRRYGSLAYHLGLLIPPTGAWLQCGPEIHHWRKAGEVIVFDDTYPHAAWNESDQERIILYIDFKIPKDVLASLGGPGEADSDSDDNSDSDDDEGGMTEGEQKDLIQNISAVQLIQMLMRHARDKKQQQKEEGGEEDGEK